MSEPLDPKREAELRSLARSFRGSLFTDAVAEIDRLRDELADSKLPTLGDLKGVLKVQADLDTARAQLALAAERESQIVLERDRLRDSVAERDRMLEATAKGMEALRAALSAQSDEVRQLREAAEPLVAANTPEVYTPVRCVMLHDLRKLAALLPAKGADHAR